MSTDKDVKQMLQEELDKRIDQIESPDYQYVERLNRADYIGMVITAIVCIGVIVFGII